MAGFLDLHNSEYASKDAAKINAYNGNDKHTILGYTLATQGPSIFMALTTKIANKADGKGGADDSNNAQLDTLKKQFKQVLKKIGAKDETQINEAVAAAQNESQTKIDTAQAELDTFTNGTDKYSTEIAQLQGQLTRGNNLTNKQVENINARIMKLQRKKEKAQNKAREHFEEVKKTETAKIEEIKKNADEAYKIFEQISNIVDVSEEDNNYVREKNETLHDFNNLRTTFLTSTNPTDRKNAAQKIKEMAEDPNNQNNNSIKATYNLLMSRIEACLNE